MLSHPVPIFDLVGHYPTNNLIGRGLILGRNHTFDPEILSSITHSFPKLSWSQGQISTRYSPFRRFHLLQSTEVSIRKIAHDLHA